MTFLSAAERLPSEVKTHIASYCSQTTLTSFARVHRIFQVEAEQALYATIAVTRHSTSRQLSVFETLAVNLEKAACVRFLQVGFRRRSLSQHDFAAKALIPVLPTLVSLKDLRIRFDANEQPFSKELTDILTSGHFQLHTLFCNEWLGISDIVKSQSSLQCLVFYEWTVPTATVQALDQLHAESIPLPITFSLVSFEGKVYDTYITLNDTHITLFPVYLRAETRSKYFQALETIISRDRGGYLEPEPLDCNRIYEVSLFFESFGDTNYVSDFVLGMSEIFPELSRLHYFLWKGPAELELAEVKQIITPARKLGCLTFRRWNRMLKADDSCALTDDLMRYYALEWAGVCPGLRRVDFVDGSYIREVVSGEWV
ncbi:hypothetical protein H0H92_004151 [Tricholoma furcatifolium]|nr:hypothetical protein H0H92_004151 [Tricholoma furcatifolium]